MVACIATLAITIAAFLKRRNAIKNEGHNTEQSGNLITTGLLSKLRSFSWESKLEGNPGNINLNSDLKNQIDNIPYNTKREISRNAFQIDAEIGAGNFGKVHKGVLDGLYGCDSKTTIAIKSTHGVGTENGITDLLCEIKLMSYIKPHPNLASMIGSCKSELTENGKLWLLIEFCECGDLLNYLKNNKQLILSGNCDAALNARCLLRLAYDVANGMQYLEEHRIMHGDLAARNVLLAENSADTDFPLAKVADFGLAKKFYENKTYEKSSRLSVPWKWMALEYLNDDYFTLKSDVWSFSVLLWEIMSFGRPPYGQKGYDEVLEQLNEGYRLPFPSNILSDSHFYLQKIYNQISNACFVSEPSDRCTFSDVVTMIKAELSDIEQAQYTEMVKLYQENKADNYLRMGLKGAFRKT